MIYECATSSAPARANRHFSTSRKSPKSTIEAERCISVGGVKFQDPSEAGADEISKNLKNEKAGPNRLLINTAAGEGKI